MPDISVAFWFLADITDVTNVYQLLGFVIVAGLQIYAGVGMNKLTKGQSQLRENIEETRAEMFRMARLTDTKVIRGEGAVAGLTGTFEAALKVAYLQGKVDGRGHDVPHPHDRIHDAAKKLAEHVSLGVPLEGSHFAPGPEAHHHEDRGPGPDPQS